MTEMKPVMVTTQHRGVFIGLIAADADMTARTLALSSVRMVLRWRDVNGLMGLAETGPAGATRLSAVADIPVLHDVTGVFAVTPEAWDTVVSWKNGEDE